MSTRDLVNQRLGSPTAELINRTLATADTTVRQVFRQDPNRVALLLVNLGSSIVYVSTDDNVTSTNGIAIAASGGAFTLDWLEDYTLPAREWFAVTSAGSSALFSLELVTLASTKLVSQKLEALSPSIQPAAT